MKFSSTIRVVKVLLASCLVVGVGACSSAPTGHSRASALQTPTSEQALQALIDGNARYAADRPVNARAHSARRAEIAASQRPLAVIVACADSRVGPELVFDQDLGDIFVVRSAGNVVDDVQLGSIEYAVEHLHAPLIVVVGHERCGAVMAAVKGGEAPGHLGAFLRPIQPAVQSTEGQAGDRVDNVVRANVMNVVRQISGTDPVIAEHVREGKVRVVGARYDLDTGRIDILN
jgi:carbonic anhydrase